MPSVRAGPRRTAIAPVSPLTISPARAGMAADLGRLQRDQSGAAMPGWSASTLRWRSRGGSRRDRPGAGLACAAGTSRLKAAGAWRRTAHRSGPPAAAALMLGLTRAAGRPGCRDPAQPRHGPRRSRSRASAECPVALGAIVANRRPAPAHARSPRAGRSAARCPSGSAASGACSCKAPAVFRNIALLLFLAFSPPVDWPRPPTFATIGRVTVRPASSLAARPLAGRRHRHQGGRRRPANGLPAGHRVPMPGSSAAPVVSRDASRRPAHDALSGVAASARQRLLIRPAARSPLRRPRPPRAGGPPGLAAPEPRILHGSAGSSGRHSASAEARRSAAPECQQHRSISGAAASLPGRRQPPRALRRHCPGRCRQAFDALNVQSHVLAAGGRQRPARIMRVRTSRPRARW